MFSWGLCSKINFKTLILILSRHNTFCHNLHANLLISEFFLLKWVCCRVDGVRVQTWFSGLGCGSVLAWYAQGQGFEPQHHTQKIYIAKLYCYIVCMYINNKFQQEILRKKEEKKKKKSWSLVTVDNCNSQTTKTLCRDWYLKGQMWLKINNASQ